MTLTDPAARRFAADTPAWSHDGDAVLVCREIRSETHDVKTFVFTPPEPRRFDFMPGQFLTFELEIGGETIHRCYTIASSPTRPYSIETTIKRTPGGLVSNWLHDELKIGMRLRVMLPAGEFSFVHHPAEKFLFISAGSGVTPLMSMTRALVDVGEDRDVIFLHAARSPDDIIFRDELATMARRARKLRLATICESDAPLTSWDGRRGRLTSTMLQEIAPDLVDREIFVCGPGPFMKATHDMLAALGHDPRRYHEESFTFEELSPQERREALEEPSPAAVPSYRIEFAKTNRAIDCPADMSILTAARLAGMRLPSSCAKGMCGTCKSKLISGEVEQTPAGGIRPREIAAGFALLCCSRPKSNVVVDR